MMTTEEWNDKPAGAGRTAMTANPFAALLAPLRIGMDDAGFMVPFNDGPYLEYAEGLAALAAAVPADLAEAGKVLDEIRRVDPFENPLAASEAEQRAADTITALLARITAQEAQINGHQDHVDTLNEVIGMSNATAQTLETALAAMTKERDEWKDAATRHHPNPVDHRYWEGRYRDEAAALAAERAKVSTLESQIAAMKGDSH